MSERSLRAHIDRRGVGGVAPARRTGFTLIELLVVVAIVALLMSVLLPTLAAARERGKRARCAANLQQIALGWQMYLDHEMGGVFPKYQKNIHWFYGGKMDQYGYPQLALNPRPINWYVGSDPYDNRTAEVFHCPADRGAEFTRTQPHWSRPSTYDYYGNSYPANGVLFAWTGNPPVVRDTIPISLSVVVFLGDHQVISPGDPYLQARWHDQDGLSMNVAFLDGHVAFTRFEFGESQTATYSFDLAWKPPPPPRDR